MKNKTQTLACPQASSTRASGPLRKKHLMSFAAVAGLVLALAPAAWAADVTWEAPTSVYTLGDATVITDGTLITAESYGDGPGLGDYTVNGVEFTGVEMRANFTNDSSGAMGQTWQYINWGTPLSTEFSGLLDGTCAAKNLTVLDSVTITLDGLESGKSYIAQFFIGDQREAANDGNPDGRYLDGNYKITGGANTSDAAHIMPIHSFVGTWVADATTQEFTITNIPGQKTGRALLNAAQWREVAAVPGSSTFAITAIDYDPDADTVTLTWRSRPNTTYKAFASPDLSDWSNELADSLGINEDDNPDDGNHITVTFDLGDAQIEDEADLFFRIQEE